MIKITTQKTDADLFGKSKWWGFPDMPDNLDYPEVSVNDDGDEYEDPLTFICQIRCDEIASLDKENLLPHEGMLYFFAALDYFLGNLDAILSPGMGEWDASYFKVLYAPDCKELHTHRIVFEDGSPFGLPAESITFTYECLTSTRCARPCLGCSRSCKSMRATTGICASTTVGCSIS